MKFTGRALTAYNRMSNKWKALFVEGWDEGEEDGVWMVLKKGYNYEGCSMVHEWSVSGVLCRMKRVTEGDTY